MRFAPNDVLHFTDRGEGEEKMKIQDIMTKDPSCVTPDATVREAAQVMKREDVGVVPVVAANADKRLVGIVTDRDIAIRCVADGIDGSCRVRDVMSTDDLATCSFGDDVDHVMDAMRNEKVRRIPIVDERGSLVGIVSQADVLRKTDNMHRAGKTVEEISEPGGRHAH
jgi:CBS domain-containing protein